ncbi:MAG TPA: VIT domain-containing protein [Phycisphaerae bacterium]|nr:VIT domain-containing protein [Phycisphaerae bacterium]
MNRARGFGWAASLLLVLVAAVEMRGAGLLVPKDKSLPPLAVKYLRVDVRVENQAAVTHVVQEFQNSTNSNLECTYIFPLPKGAAVSDFAMYVNGKRTKGELVEKEKARQVYEEIVRRMRDPALLEYMDGSLLRMRIFPVPAKGTQKVEVEYAEVVPMDGGLAEYVFPLRMGDKASQTLEDFTVAVRVKSETPLKSVYSPTHEVGVSRPNDYEAVAGVETKAAVLDRDFQLFWTVDKKDFGLSLMTYRPDPKQAGLFLILVCPKGEVNADERVPRDVAFVLDTSGSMKGGKIEQAKKALKFCIGELGKDDRFAIVQFSTAAQAFETGWTRADDGAKKKACAWIDGFEAAGGTNAGEALERVFALPIKKNRPATIFFVTDGRPTVNVTDPEALSKLVKENNKGNLRIFTFGVGDDVNTHLLDRMSDETGGLPEYVRGGEAIDGKVTRLFAKMSHPVLTDLAIEIPGVKVTEMYPKQLPDLFRGSQAVLVGSYEGAGDSVIRLRGRVGDKKEEFVYEGTFPEKCTDRSFIGPIWAHRKIGYLLDQIRLHGEDKELKDEVIRLSVAYGIETPYTSYLVLENSDQYKQYGLAVGGARPVAGVPPVVGAPATSPRPAPEPAADSARREKAADRVEREFSRVGRPSSGGAAKPTETPAVAGGGGGGPPYASGGSVAGFRAGQEDLKTADTGAKAVDIAQNIQRLRQAENFGRDMRGVQNVQQRGNRQVANYRGVWVDDQFQGTEKVTKVRWGSSAYFRLARERTDLREIFSLGQRAVIVTARNQAVLVDTDEGVEELDDAQVKALFTDLER